jgi:DNA-directed RNA polymerase subunit F
MTGKKSERTVSIPEVKKIMEDVKQKITEMDVEEGITHFQEITFNYVNRFAKMSDKDAIKIKKLLMDKYNLEEIFAVNIINIDPQNIPELKMILEKSLVGKSFNNEMLQDVMSQIQELKSS